MARKTRATLSNEEKMSKATTRALKAIRRLATLKVEATTEQANKVEKALTIEVDSAVSALRAPKSKAATIEFKF